MKFDVEYLPRVNRIKVTFGWNDGGINGANSLLIDAEKRDEFISALNQMVLDMKSCDRHGLG